MFDAILQSFVAGLAVDLTQCFYVIGYEGNRDDKHVACSSNCKFMNYLMERRLKPLACSHLALVAESIGQCPSALPQEEHHSLLDLFLVGIALFNNTQRN